MIERTETCHSRKKKNLKIFIKLEERSTTVSNTRMAAVSDKGAKACE